MRIHLIGWAILAVALADTAEAQPAAGDWWRYVEAQGGRPAAAELVYPNPEATVFRVTCDRPRHELVVEYLVGEEEGPDTWSEAERKSPMLIGMYEREASAEEDRRADLLLTMPPDLRRDRAVGRAKVTPQMAERISRMEVIRLDAVNGPANTFEGGASLAFKRIARECAQQ